MRYDRLAGLGGVSEHETESARRWAQRFEWPMLLVVLWILLQWILEGADAIPPATSRVADWLVWLAFVTETVVLVTLVRDKAGYLLGNWINLLIIVTGFPLLWGDMPLAGILRGLRAVLMFGLLLRLSRTWRQVLVQHHLGNSLLIMVVVVVVAGVVIAYIDPGIKTPWEGIWWALATVTTVGYGDVVPVSEQGRIVGIVLLILSVVLLSLVTANISAFLVSRGAVKGESEVHERLRRMEKRLEHIERMLKESLEKTSNSKSDGQS